MHEIFATVCSATNIGFFFNTNHTEQVQQYLQTIQNKFYNIYKPHTTSSTISTNHTEQAQQYLHTIQNKFNNIYKPYRTSSTISTNHTEQVQQLWSVDIVELVLYGL
jgi:uncharacterized protein YsxB (DUF464 family)